MKILEFVLVIFLFSFFVSCENNSEPEDLNCEKFSTGIVNLDQEIVSEELSKILSDLNPKITSTDKLGHENNLSTLIDRINSQCGNIKSELICYACIETYPLQSEIKVTTDSLGISVYRIIDILTSSEKKLSFVRIHK